MLIISSASPSSHPPLLGTFGWTCASEVVPAPTSLQSVSLSSAGQWLSCMAHGEQLRQSHNFLFLPSADWNSRQASLERGKCCLHTRSWRGSHFGWCKALRDVCKGVNQKHLVKGSNTGCQGGNRWVTSESLSRHWVRETLLCRLLLSWRRLSAAQMHQTGEAKSCSSLIAMSQAATWRGLNMVKRKSQCQSNDHVWKNLSHSVSINAAVSSLTVFQVPRPVLQFLDQTLPKAGVPATDGCISYQKELGHYLMLLFSGCCDRNLGQSDPVAFGSFIPTLLTCAARVSQSWDASQSSNNIYLHSLKDFQRNLCRGFTHR